MALNLKDRDDKRHDTIKKNGRIGRCSAAFYSVTAELNKYRNDCIWLLRKRFSQWNNNQYRLGTISLIFINFESILPYFDNFQVEFLQNEDIHTLGCIWICFQTYKGFLQSMKGIRCPEVVSNPAFLDLHFFLWFLAVLRAFGSWSDLFWTSRVHINENKNNSNVSLHLSTKSATAVKCWSSFEIWNKIRSFTSS